MAKILKNTSKTAFLKENHFFFKKTNSKNTDNQEVFLFTTKTGISTLAQLKISLYFRNKFSSKK